MKSPNNFQNLLGINMIFFFLLDIMANDYIIALHCIDNHDHDSVWTVLD